MKQIKLILNGIEHEHNSMSTIRDIENFYQIDNYMASVNGEVVTAGFQLRDGDEVTLVQKIRGSGPMWVAYLTAAENKLKEAQKHLEELRAHLTDKENL